MKALSVHGCGAKFASTSGRVGLEGAYGPVDCWSACEPAALRGRDGVNSSVDIVSSSSASQSDAAAKERGELSGGGVARYNDGGDGFRRIMARFQDLILEFFQPILPAFEDWEHLWLTLWLRGTPGRATLLGFLDVDGNLYQR